MRFPDSDDVRPCFAEPPANLLLRQLPAEDRSRLEAHLQAVPVSRGMNLFGELDASEFVYFSQGPLISLEQSNRVEVALIGGEGLVGWPSLVGCSCSPYRAVVRGRDGIVAKMPTRVLMAIAAASPALQLILNRFITVVSVQMGETIGAFALHRIDIRLARWILLRHDRLGGDEILAHHDEIADNLGARRASITDSLHVIEGEGLVRCRRGRIWVRNRVALEQMAARCYGVAELQYRELIGKFGKSVVPRASEPVRPAIPMGRSFT